MGEDEVEVKARLQSLTLPHAGNWLNVAPIITLGLHLRPQEFVLAASYRLGLPLYDEGRRAHPPLRRDAAIAMHGGQTLPCHSRRGSNVH